MKPIKRRHGIHMLTTQCVTLDDALDVLAEQQRRKKISDKAKGRPMSLKQLSNLGKIQSRMKPVTLSDRVSPPEYSPGVRSIKKPDVVWTKEQVIAAYESGYFKPNELAQRAKVRRAVIASWIWPSKD